MKPTWLTVTPDWKYYYVTDAYVVGDKPLGYVRYDIDRQVWVAGFNNPHNKAQTFHGPNALQRAKDWVEEQYTAKHKAEVPK